MEKDIASKKLIEDFNAFRDHCIIIRSNYNTHRELFLSGSDELLKKTAQGFFSDISEIMVNYWIVRVCAIMDRAEIKVAGEKRENISIALIDKQLESEGLMTYDIAQLSKALKEYGAKIRPARDKRLGHNDQFFQFSNEVLGETTPEELDTFLENLQKYCDEVGRAIGIGPLDFGCSACDGDAQDLLRVLREYHHIK